jgi:hypothetical protein
MQQEPRGAAHAGIGNPGDQCKKFKVTTDSNHTRPVAEDLIDQDFTATRANEKWVSDISVPQQAA